MSSKTEVCNMALSHLSQGQSIQNIDSERSENAAAARVFFDVALDSLLRKRDWSFARKTQALDYIGVDPTGVWGAMFRYPSDCVMLRACGYPTRYHHQFANTFAMGADDQGAVIYTQDKSAYFTYTFRNTVTEAYPADFTITLSYLLAYLMAPRLTGGDPFGLAQKAYQSYELMVSQAAAASYNEEGPRLPITSTFQSVRNS